MTNVGGAFQAPPKFSRDRTVIADDQRQDALGLWRVGFWHD